MWILNTPQVQARGAQSNQGFSLLLLLFFFSHSGPANQQDSVCSPSPKWQLFLYPVLLGTGGGGITQTTLFFQHNFSYNKTRHCNTRYHSLCVCVWSERERAAHTCVCLEGLNSISKLLLIFLCLLRESSRNNIFFYFSFTTGLVPLCMVMCFLKVHYILFFSIVESSCLQMFFFPLIKKCLC